MTIQRKDGDTVFVMLTLLFVFYDVDTSLHEVCYRYVHVTVHIQTFVNMTNGKYFLLINNQTWADFNCREYKINLFMKCRCVYAVFDSSSFVV